jgi:hypothetical protein
MFISFEPFITWYFLAALPPIDIFKLKTETYKNNEKLLHNQQVIYVQLLYSLIHICKVI